MATEMQDSIFNDLEYIAIVPFEMAFRKLGKIAVFLLWACIFWFGFEIFRNISINEMSILAYENRIFAAYIVTSIMIAGMINMIRNWLSGRRLELARELDMDFQYQYIEKNKVYPNQKIETPVFQKTPVNYGSTFSVNESPEAEKEKQQQQQTQKPEFEFSGKKEGFINSEELLENLIGLQSVKDEVLKLRLRLELEKKQELQGVKKKSKYNMHMFFTGNPGTGKTTVARIITGILYDMGYISENKCVEVGKDDIVGQFLGQSAQKAKAAIREALGGVLFIDEAYSLCEKYQGDGFAKETVEVLLKSMEDYRDDLIIIFAGYTNEMKKFKEMNPGLKSRIGLTIEFPDYDSDELTQIFVKKAEDSGYSISKDVIAKVHAVCDMACKEKDFGNGRFVENFFREVESEHAMNTRYFDAYDSRIMKILPEDVQFEVLDKIL